MWTSLGLENFILKLERTKSGCSIHVSDFIRIWNSTLKNEEIEVISKRKNPMIEAPAVKLIELVFSLFDKIKSISKTYQIIGDVLILQLESDLSGVHFQFEVHMKQQNTNMLFQEIVLPLVTVAARLKLRENKLIEIIADKEAEINEYRRENTPIKRSHLITKEFSLDGFEREWAATNSSVYAIASSPSLIFDLIDTKMFNSLGNIDSENADGSKKSVTKNLECIIPDESTMSSYKSDTKVFRKATRNKINIDVPKNIYTRKKKETYQDKLKF